MRTFGKIHLAPAEISKPERWVIKGDRHVITMLKRVFSGVEQWHISEVEMSNSPENCRNLIWFLARYPMEVKDLVADDGADPIMVETLGLKQDQVDGIRNPDDIFPERKGGPGKNITALAEAYLKGKV